MKKGIYNNCSVYASGRANNYKCLCANYGSPQIYKTIPNISNLIDKNLVIAGDFSTPLKAMDRSSRHMVKKETKALNDTLDQIDLTDILRTLCSKATEYIFFSSAHGTFSRIDHIWVTNQLSTRTKRLRSYLAYFQTVTL